MLRARQRLDKYRIERRIGQGGFASVYQAYDTLEGVKVALKIPKSGLKKGELEDFLREIRLAARLDHPHILPIKNASFIEGRLVVAYPLGSGSLADRLTHRLSFDRSMGYAHQILQALAYAHANRIAHCDVKPENLILFPGDRLRLADFGLARVARHTLSASGSGTVGYVAPEQAMGKPSRASDVFAAGLILYRMLAGALPEWPYDWPPPNYTRLRRKAHPELVEFLRRALQVDKRRRFPDARRMLDVFERVRHRRAGPKVRRTPFRPLWRDRRNREFKRLFGRSLRVRGTCPQCGAPVSEWMTRCPWCGHQPSRYQGPTELALRCTRCGHGMKKDWKFCAMCYGPAQGPRSERVYPDRRYAARCRGCRGPLFPFTRYCPWCRRKVREKWKAGDSEARCSSCGWGIAPDFWEHCPWCGKAV